MNIHEYQKRYEKWWLGKMVRQAGTNGKFRRVTKVVLHGPPSFVYGIVTLHFKGGGYENVTQVNAFRPRKRHIEVKDEGK